MTSETETVAELIAEGRRSNCLIMYIDPTELLDRIAAAHAREIKDVQWNAKRYTDALDHIARVSFGARHSTRRSRWIVERAKSAINNDQEWRLMKRPNNYHAALERLASHPLRVEVGEVAKDATRMTADAAQCHVGSLGESLFNIKWNGKDDPQFTFVGWKFIGISGTPGSCLKALAGWLIQQGDRIDSTYTRRAGCRGSLV